MIDVDVILLDTQKADIGIVRNVCSRDLCHQEGKKCQRQQN